MSLEPIISGSEIQPSRIFFASEFCLEKSFKANAQKFFPIFQSKFFSILLPSVRLISHVDGKNEIENDWKTFLRKIVIVNANFFYKHLRVPEVRVRYDRVRVHSNFRYRQIRFQRTRLLRTLGYNEQ